MNQNHWDELVAALRQQDDVERAIAAAEKLQCNATLEDVLRLLTLLKDDSFFVREAAAWPLSDLGATEALPELLEALHRGFQENHDNDGLCAALTDLAEMNAPQAAVVLQRIVASGKLYPREHAAWLLQFCDDERDG